MNWALSNVSNVCCQSLPEYIRLGRLHVAVLYAELLDAD